MVIPFLTLPALLVWLLSQNRAARIRVGKGDRPLNYEQALHPHQIGHRKGWLSAHTSKYSLPPVPVFFDAALA